MIAMYKGEFIQAQFIESHLKRMTASIESHFGQRTFYLDLLFEQFGILKFPMIIGSLIVCFQTLRKKNILTGVMLCIFVPWFVLLNLTKTKIAWYLHPVIPQFAFLASYVLFPFKKIVATILLIGILASIFYWNFVVHPFYKTQFSKTEEYQQIAISARNTCTSLEVLVEAQGRKAHDTLSQMNLLISTSEWWGNHPSMAYYYGGPTSYIYSINRLISEYDKKNKDFCIAFEKTDMLYLKTLIDKGKIVDTNSQWILLKKID